MPRFRRKISVITAEQFRSARIGESSVDWIRSFPPGVCFQDDCGSGGKTRPHLHTMHAGQSVVLADGDWVIPEPDGIHYYPCKPDVFANTYELIREDNMS